MLAGGDFPEVKGGLVETQKQQQVFLCGDILLSPLKHFVVSTRFRLNQSSLLAIQYKGPVLLFISKVTAVECKHVLGQSVVKR